jgi:hypothetical protein
MKLTSVQQNIISKMREGYELGHFRGVTKSFYSIQKGGCGKGGATVNITFPTFAALRSMNLIQPFGVNTFSLSRYELSELGKTVLLNLL